MELHGPGISAYVDMDVEARIYAEDADYGARKAGTGGLIRSEDLVGSDDKRLTYGFAQENEHFARCILDGVEPAANFADAAKSAELCDRIIASSITRNES
jgi:predicted dehydrogenase